MSRITIEEAQKLNSTELIELIIKNVPANEIRTCLTKLSSTDINDTNILPVSDSSGVFKPTVPVTGVTKYNVVNPPIPTPTPTPITDNSGQGSSTDPIPDKLKNLNTFRNECANKAILIVQRDYKISSKPGIDYTLYYAFNKSTNLYEKKATPTSQFSIEKCNESGDFNEQTCEYFVKWLKSKITNDSSSDEIRKIKDVIMDYLRMNIDPFIFKCKDVTNILNIIGISEDIIKAISNPKRIVNSPIPVVPVVTPVVTPAVPVVTPAVPAVTPLQQELNAFRTTCINKAVLVVKTDYKITGKSGDYTLYYTFNDTKNIYEKKAMPTSQFSMKKCNEFTDANEQTCESFYKWIKDVINNPTIINNIKIVIMDYLNYNIEPFILKCKKGIEILKTIGIDDAVLNRLNKPNIPVVTPSVPSVPAVPVQQELLNIAKKLTTKNGLLIYLKPLNDGKIMTYYPFTQNGNIGWTRKLMTLDELRSTKYNYEIPDVNTEKYKQIEEDFNKLDKDSTMYKNILAIAKQLNNNQITLPYKFLSVPKASFGYSVSTLLSILKRNNITPSMIKKMFPGKTIYSITIDDLIEVLKKYNIDTSMLKKGSFGSTTLKYI